MFEDSQRVESDARQHLQVIAHITERLPKSYGQAFRYIVYRDINRRLMVYENLMRRRIRPKTCDPRFVARHA